MTATADTQPTTKPAAGKPSREDDPRGPLKRLARLFDEGTVELLTPFDDSGFVAAIGLIDGTKAASYASDPTIQGGASARASGISSARSAAASTACGRTASSGSRAGSSRTRTRPSRTSWR